MTKYITSLIVVIVIIAVLPMQALADSDVNNNGNTGTGTTTGSTGSSFTWWSALSGYRFTIINNNYQQVSNTIDIDFTDPNSDAFYFGDDYYTSPRTNTLSTSQDDYTHLVFKDLESKGVINDGGPPAPIYYTADNPNTPTAGGSAFEQWFTDGATGVGSVTIYQARPTSSGGSSGGTTRPGISTNSSSSNSMPRVTVAEIANNPSRLASVESDAKIALENQNQLEAAQELADSEAQALNDRINFEMMHSTEDYGTLYNEYVNAGTASLADEASSNAEYNLTITTLVGDPGSYYDPGSTIEEIMPYGITLNSGASTQSKNNNTKLQSIPLDGSSSKGYADAIINMTEGDEFYFKFKPGLVAGMLNGGYSADGLDTSYDHRNPTTIMAENGLSILVEPIFWLVPGNLGLSDVYSNYVYGTVDNINQFYNIYGYRWGSAGGQYGVLGGSLGWRCLAMSDDWPNQKDYPGTTIQIPAASYSGTKSDLSSLLDSASPYKGYAMHIYTTTKLNIAEQVNSLVTSNCSTQTEATGAQAPGPAPYPDQKPLRTGYTENYDIVKYYETTKADGTIDTTAGSGPFYAYQNPPDIRIMDEKDYTNGYTVTGWFITTKDIQNGVAKATYEGEKAIDTITRSGNAATSPNPVQLETESDGKTKSPAGAPYSGEKTLVVVLQHPQPALPPNGSGPLELTESEISKSVTTMNSAIPSWGPRNFVFTYADMSGSDTHYTGDADNPVAHACTAIFGDSAYDYIITNSDTIDTAVEANAAGGGFASRMVNNTMSGNASINGGTNTLSTAEYQTTIWRSQDLPTIASYNEPSSLDLKTLLGRYGKEPVGDRALNGPYNKTLSIQLSVDSTSDVTTNSVHSYDGDVWHTSTHKAPAVSDHTGAVKVDVFRGTNNKSVGQSDASVISSVIPTITPFGGATSTHSAGYMVGGTTPIYYYPYIRMTYQETGQSALTSVNVLSQWVSELLPNDTAEASWYNPTESTSMDISSTQWSLHASAVSGGKSWNGPDQVLPGGALFQLNTGTTPTKVALVSWQTIITDPERSALDVALSTTEYTLAKATAEQQGFVDQAEDTLSELRTVQWMNADTTSTNAWDNNGKSVKILNAGQSLSNLGLSTSTSDEDKYRLSADTNPDNANKGNLDVIKDDASECFFKVFSDTSGNIYLAKAIAPAVVSATGNTISDAARNTALASLANVNGSNTGGLTPILTRSQGVASLSSQDAKDLDQRTQIITNFLKTLERDEGSDSSASWASSDGKWYSEAWNGVYVVRKEDSLDVGFSKPGIRSAVVDPKVSPPSDGQSDMYSKAFLSQFCMNNKSSTLTAASKPDGFLASFKGRDIILPDMTLMYQTKHFYITNVSTQDLNG